MQRDKFIEILGLVGEFVSLDPVILAVGLCGSWARGTAKPGSDIDLSIITQDKNIFREITWIKALRFEKIHDKLVRFEDRTYGQVWSRHVFLESGTEIEFSFADRTWADVQHLDAGTRKVVSDGYRILYDPQRILYPLVEKVKAIKKP